jgi:CRISPR/Cas system CSM-associated protein Csm2 small subunit
MEQDSKIIDVKLEDLEKLADANNASNHITSQLNLNKIDMNSVYKIVKYIQNSSIKNKDEVFSVKYAQFKASFPILFELSCKDERIDENMLQMMLNMASKITKNEISQFDGSALIGQTLFNKYIDPIVKENK